MAPPSPKAMAIPSGPLLPQSHPWPWKTGFPRAVNSVRVMGMVHGKHCSKKPLSRLSMEDSHFYTTIFELLSPNQSTAIYLASITGSAKS